MMTQSDKDRLVQMFKEHYARPWWYRILKLTDMPRLNKERQDLLEPKRMQFAIDKLTELGYKELTVSVNSIAFVHKEKIVRFYPYSGWFQGKSVKPGRGIDNLIKQLK